MTTNLVDLGPNPLPRKLSDGLYWLGSCLDAPYQGSILHGYNSCFLVSGAHSSMIIETGHPQDLPAIMQQLDDIEDEISPVRWVFVTHAEPPHSSGLGMYLEKYPQARAVGDLRDFHLFFPKLVDRFTFATEGEEIDLGNGSVRFVDAVIRDLPATLWAFDTSRRVLFPGDGFAYSHYHQADQCGRTAEEVPGLPFEAMVALFAEFALHWTKYTDIEPYITRLENMLGPDLGVEMIAPTHGLPITDLAATVPLIYGGLRALNQRGGDPTLD